MTSPQRHTEPNANFALGELLKAMLPNCEVRPEQTRTVPNHAGRHPDILITAPGRSPVVVEAEYEPNANPEGDAAPRLGLTVAGETRPVEAAIALRYPEAIGGAYDLPAALAEARLSWCVLYENGSRFPESGWLDGGVADLADLIRLVSVPQKAVDAAADDLQNGIDLAADVLNQMPQTRPDISPAIAKRLNINDVPQMRRMACAIIANAMLFHERLAGRHGIKPLAQICNPDNPNPQADIIAAWNGILSINYLDIFEIARDIVAELPTQEAAQILNIISFQVLNIAGRGVNNDHDLTGQVFQRLIADRKYLATFYTLPASAALLARLAVSRLDGVDWGNAAAIGQLRIADFACGTGALLSAVYEQIAARHERAAGSAAALHPLMMEQVIYGCDVMPSAVHITGSTLAGLQPTVGFTHSNLHTMAYGRQDDGSVRIGSLEMLDANSELNSTILGGYFDLVIMNPPFTRNTTNEGEYSGEFNAAFAAFGTSDEVQNAMGRRMKSVQKGTCYDGNAGIASAFAALADKKLKPGGVLALVLPLSVASGLSWRKFRRMLDDQYVDLTVLSIASNGKDMSFSSDTGIAECLVIARKVRATDQQAHRARFTSLRRRPAGFAHAAAVAQAIRRDENDGMRTVEDGPYGGTPLRVGDDTIGAMLSAPQVSGANWGNVRLSDYALAQTAHALTQKQLWLPAQVAPLKLLTVQLNELGKLGLHHRDVEGPPPRGPFDISKSDVGPTNTYVALWNHNARKETRILCEPDAQLVVRQDMEEKAAVVYATASRSHLNVEFTFGSQALSVALTDRESIGGSSWPNVIFTYGEFDYVFAVWGNSTLGLVSHWWHSNRQQSSKVRMTVRSAESLPVLDFRTLTADQLTTAQAIFDEFRDKELQPAYLADADPNRALLDRRVICDLLGFDDSTYQAVRRLAAKWCAEPSVHGGKPRPPDASLVIPVPRIPVRVAPRAQLVAEKRQAIEEYEKQYGMSSAEMAALVDRDEIAPTIEVIKWYHAYDGLKFLIETTPTTGTRGTITEPSTKPV